MSLERSQEELAGGFLRCRVGASTTDMTTLKMRDEREWRALLAAKVRELAETDVGEADFTDFGSPATLTAAATLIHFPAEALLDLVDAYDKSQVLGGKTVLEETADSAQLWTIFQRIMLVVFPFVTSVGSWLNALQTPTPDGAASSLMNGLLPTGAGVPTN